MSDLTVTCSCGGDFIKQNAKGQFFSFGEFGQVRMLHDCQILQCDTCGEVMEAVGEGALDDGLQKSLAGNVEELLELIKQKHRIFNKYVAAYLGCGAECLSRYQNPGSGKVIPCVDFLSLKCIAEGGRVYMEKSLKMRWEAPAETQPTSGARNLGSGRVAARHS